MKLNFRSGQINTCWYYIQIFQNIPHNYFIN